MALLLIRNDKNYKSWIEAIKTADPDIPVFTPETLQDPSQIKMALTWKAPTGSFSDYPNLQVVGSLGAGVDHLFDDPSLPDNVKLTRVVDNKLAGDMQEFVLGLCLNRIKNFDRYQDLKKEKNWKPLPYKRVSDVKVGILGFGTLGQAVGKMLQSVGLQVSGWSHSRKEIEGIKSYKANELSGFLSQAEILVCLLPLTEETKNILNADLFNQLPEGAYLINVARGGHLQETDLLQALESGKLSGAALDVFNEEPLPKDNPFWEHDKIFLTPHVASVSNPFSVAPQIAENYKRMKQGKELLNRVFKEKGY